MDPTSKKHHSRPSRPDPVPSSSLQRPTSKHPIAHLPSSYDSKAFAPVKGAAPPRVDTTLQAKAMALSLNAGPSKASKKQQHPQPKKPITAAAMAHQPLRPTMDIDCREKKEGGEEEEKRLVVLGDGRRKSFCGSEIDMGQILSGVGAKVVAEDMAPFMQMHAVTCARKTYDGLDKFSSKALAFSLKKVIAANRSFLVTEAKVSSIFLMDTPHLLSKLIHLPAKETDLPNRKHWGSWRHMLRAVAFELSGFKHMMNPRHSEQKDNLINKTFISSSFAGVFYGALSVVVLLNNEFGFEFDKVYGPAWHCVVGTSFGSFVTHSVGGFIYFSIDKLYILLFKTAVQRAD
ncbi:hypothetical protein ACLOJK_021043 [Asimina triloba]